MRWRRKNTRPQEAARQPAQEAAQEADGPFELECRLGFQHGVMLLPGPQTGPEAVPVPLTGHEIAVTLTARGRQPVWISGLAATVDGHLPSENTQPLVSGTELRSPHLVVWLDEDPPGLRSAPGHDGSIPRDHNGRTELILAPVTADSRLVCWTLWVRVTCGDQEGEVYTRPFPLRTTAVSHWTSFSPGGSPPRSVPASEMATGHWHPPPSGGSSDG